MNKSLNLDIALELLKKYDRPGPRYTSYPTAPHFHEGFGSKEFEEEIIQTNEVGQDGDLSLYFHLPFCQSLCYYCACNVIITHSSDRKASYVEYLKREIDAVSSRINPNRKVVQLHWGGGTPTYLSAEQIEDIAMYIRDHFNFATDAEVSIEVDPRALTPAHLPVLRKVGFNRISMGVQDFDPKVQEAVNRIQPEEMTRGVIQESRDLGFDSINVDLIYGLPFQTVDTFVKSVDKIIKISPDRLAVFNYAHVPWMKKHQNIIQPETLPSAGEKLSILKMVIEKLTGAGYVMIGMDHFAKPADELSVALKEKTLYRNFQGYTTRAGAEVYAMGITSISQLHNVYAQNVKTTKEYEEMIDDGKLPVSLGYRLNDDDQVRRHVITELMCNNVVEKAEVNKKYGIDFDSYFADSIAQLDEFVNDGLISLQPDRIQVHENGRLVVRNIAMAFDAYLEADRQKQKPIYSRTV
ncbi:MAG: oxygen-independent coproporphyrinogen III oxidase [Calditrichaceae bacterium]